MAKRFGRDNKSRPAQLLFIAHTTVYNQPMIYEIQTTEAFEKWAAKLQDKIAARAIASRLLRLRAGHLGDVKNLGDGISEMRVFAGKGYRLYFTIRDHRLIILLCGGDKSTQDQDIKKVKELAKGL